MDEVRDEAKERLLYAFGQNEHGELGLGDTVERWTPTLSEASRGQEIESIAAGNELTAVLTSTREVYSCGVNGEGQCGIRTQEAHGARPRSVLSFTKVFLEEPRFNSGGRVAQVHAGNGCEHLTIVAEDGQLHNCGINSAGQLGLGDTSQGHIFPRPVLRLLGRNVVKVACSYFHSVVVTQDYDNDGRNSDYETWTFGGNGCGQLGQGDRVRRVVPTPVKSLQGLRVLSVACGLYHTVILVAGGGLYAFGKNDNGQLGLQDREWRLSPERVKSCASVVFQQLACGYFHTVALSETGQLLSFGRNDFGQLGLGHLRDTWEPTQVPRLEGKKIVQVACGSYHTVPLDAYGRVYPFGRNNHGQLGTGTKQDSSRPCYIEKLSGKFILQVAAGFYHTLCLAGPAAEGSNRDRGTLRRARSLNSDLYILLGNPSRSDVSFVVEGKVIHGHRCIISARCEPLGRMLEGSMKEASAEGGSIPLPDQRYRVFLAFLEFLYTDKVMALGSDTLDVEFALDLLELADRYLVDALKQFCEDAILKTVPTENACDLLTAVDGQTTSLRDRCLEYIARQKDLPETPEDDAGGDVDANTDADVDASSGSNVHWAKGGGSSSNQVP